MKLANGTKRAPVTIGPLLLGGGGFANYSSISPNGEVQMFGNDVYMPFIKAPGDRLFREAMNQDLLPEGYKMYQMTDAIINTGGHKTNGSGTYDIYAGNTICYLVIRAHLFRSTDYFRTVENTKVVFGMKNFRENDGQQRAWNHHLAVDDQNENVVVIGAINTDGMWYCLDTSVADPEFVQVSGIPACSTWSETFYIGKSQSGPLVACDPTSAVVGGIRQRWVAVVWNDTEGVGGIYKTETGPAGTWTRMSGNGPGDHYPFISMFYDQWGDLWGVPAFWHEPADTPGYPSYPDYQAIGPGSFICKLPAGSSTWETESLATVGGLVQASSWIALGIDPTNRDRRVLFDANGTYKQTFEQTPGNWIWSYNHEGSAQSYYAPKISWLQNLADGHKAVGGITPHRHPDKLGWFFVNHGTGVADLPPADPGSVTHVNLYDRSEGLENLVTAMCCSVPGGSFFVNTWDKGIWKRNNWDVFPTTHQPAQYQGIYHSWDMDWAPASGGGTIIVSHLQDNGGGPCTVYSLDDGDTWVDFPNKPLDTDRKGGCIAAQNDQIIAAVNFNNGQASYTLDRGATPWQPLVLGGHTMPTSGTESGWGWHYAQTKKILIASKETPGRWWAWNYGPEEPLRPELRGMWRSDNGPAGPWTRVFSGAPTGGAFNWQNQTFFYEVPGHANMLLATGGLDQAIESAISLDGGATWGPIVTNGGVTVFAAFNFAFGKAEEGAEWPVIRFLGHIDYQGHPLNQFGTWETRDGFATCTKIHPQIPGAHIDSPRGMYGDLNQERWCYAWGGSGTTGEQARHVFTDAGLN